MKQMVTVSSGMKEDTIRYLTSVNGMLFEICICYLNFGPRP